ncbi:MAG: hypothetical protein LLG45_13235 [Actinomycetia bacterium]|nr:hypothetical protein [Actinomycetes bacterium]
MKYNTQYNYLLIENKYSSVMAGTSKVTMLEEAHAIKVLLILLREGPTRKTNLYSFIGSNTSPIQKRLDEFEKLGLVTIEPDPKHHSAFIVQLTPKGKRVAEKLVEVDEII